MSTVAAGITDDSGKGTLISQNQINPAAPNNNYITFVGIRSTRAFTSATVIDNHVYFSDAGIQVIDPVNATLVQRNIVNVSATGIAVGQA